MKWRPCLALASTAFLAGAEPLKLHPENPHYFLYQGQPTILLTSAEHYGAVLNADFDFRLYLATLAKDGLNYTRIFTGGAYVEPLGAFNIAKNTLAPSGERFLAPWARSDQPGYAGGGNKFDLSKWNPGYFARLKDFLTEAAKNGIVVEVTLFCPSYKEEDWRLNPLNPSNNINGLDEVERTDVYTLAKNAGRLAWQERLARKMVEELAGFENQLFEICNEPYFGGVTIEWQHHIAEVLAEAMKKHPPVKLIAQNIANGSQKVEKAHPAVSIFNFHYAAPPTTVEQNYELRRVIGDDETGFRGTSDAPYRMEAWDFLLAGGGLYNNLDYSFTVGHENGDFDYPSTQPGGGNSIFRRQIAHLGRWIRSHDFVHMKPANELLRGKLPFGASARLLAKEGKEYAFYVRTAQLPGQFSARWTGSLRPRQSGEFKLTTVSNDGVRLWLDEKLLIDHWDEHPTAEDSTSVRFEAGSVHKLKLEYFYAGGQATLGLLWESADVKKAPIPAEAFQTPENQTGLFVEYFADMTLSARSKTAVEPKLEIAAPTARDGLAKLKADELTLTLELPQGRYRAEWFDTKSGQMARREDFDHSEGERSLAAPAFEDDIALSIRARVD